MKGLVAKSTGGLAGYAGAHIAKNAVGGYNPWVGAALALGLSHLVRGGGPFQRAASTGAAIAGGQCVAVALGITIPGGR